MTNIDPFKGGISGAFKRVAASGYGIGRYLYKIKEIFAECTLEKKQGYTEKAKTKDGKTIYWKIPKIKNESGNVLTEPQITRLMAKAKAAGMNEKIIDGWIKNNYKLEDKRLMSKEQYDRLCNKLDTAGKKTDLKVVGR